MTKGQMLQRLEALLDRVRSRAAQSRHPTADAPRAVESAAAADAGAAVGKSSAAEFATEEAQSGDGRDSRERLVAADVGSPEPRPSEAPPRVQESVPPIDVAELEVPEEEEEKPPLSSRRPVAPEPEERIAQIAFGAEEPREPIHTPPPESGRLPAAAVTDFEQDPDHTMVRSATPLLPRRGAEGALHGLVPEAIRPQLVPSDAVAEVIAEPPPFVPATFVALLDASLEL